jgi:hypothetical protein
MASAVATDKLACNYLIKNYDHDPGTTNAKVISADGGTTEIWFDLRDYDHVGFLLIWTAGSNDFTLFEIVASDSEDETDGSVTQIKTSGTLTVDTVAEGAFLECSAEEVSHLASTYDLRYVSARVTAANADCEGQVVVIAHARRPHDAVTAASW